MTPCQNRVVRQFVEACKKLESVINEARTLWPEAELYIDANNFNLMSGKHHEGKDAHSCQERVIIAVSIKNFDTGDW